MAKNATRRVTEPAVTPTATIRTMIVCVPGDLPRESLTAHQLDRNFGVQGTLSPRFWASPAVHLWQRSQMFGLRKGRPAYCAGGPARLLDLTGMRHAAAVGAGIRHQQFSRAVHGTRNATPWHVYEARHLADPQEYPRDKAVADFTNQPRVNAIRMHNAATYGAGQIALNELEMYQAGCMAYQHHSALTAVAGDALITAEGARLAPASDAMADRVTYLEQAHRLLAAIDPDQRLLAVAL
ncbi:hypothetical protein [Micromonospora aurantiaca (nom. illeg.)]|uniref:hypothetical protein n=1 Tax=Micromonospora aurantiaca (nom. illeg.) TaxID=47850 RepID=UPI000F3E1EA6|nr:hypothetical protein [Micromonospora aurantiaca]RNH98119.1 hypothetical protein EEZ25_27895 [Micromonospora aurantiaca]